MCRLYKSVGEYDVVSAVLSQYVTTHQVTLEAIDAELHGDYVLAAKRYNQVSLLWYNVLMALVSRTDIHHTDTLSTAFH